MSKFDGVEVTVTPDKGNAQQTKRKTLCRRTLLGRCLVASRDYQPGEVILEVKSTLLAHIEEEDGKKRGGEKKKK